MASPGTTPRAAPGLEYEPKNTNSFMMFEICTTINVFVATGTAPDASQDSGIGASARWYIPAGETRNLFCKPGDRLAWVAA